MARVIIDWDARYKKAIIKSGFLENIRAQFSVPNEDKQRQIKQGCPAWCIPDFISPITNTGRFEIGLYFEIIKVLDLQEMDYEVTTTQLLEDMLVQTYSWGKSYEVETLGKDLRPYQSSGVKRCIHMGYGNIIVGTAGGKTLLMASLIKTIQKYEEGHGTAIIVMPAGLIDQTYKEFKTYGLTDKELSLWGGKHDYVKKPIMIIGAETLKANLTTFKAPKPIPEWKWKPNESDFNTYKAYLSEFAANEVRRKTAWNKKRKMYLKELDDVDLMLVDEVHGLRKGNAINKTIAQFSTRHKFGFTGTMPEDLTDEWNVIGTIGPVLIDIDSFALREMGFVAPIQARIIKLHYRNPPAYKLDSEVPNSAYIAECDYLYHSEYRNKVITHLVSNFEKNTLIMVNKIDHGETLEAILKKNTDKEVYFIQGSVAMDEREKLRALMETKDNIICIAMSRIFAVGINIKNLHYIIFAQGGKAKVTIIQSIGRGLRLHGNKECLLLIDIADDAHYGNKHLLDRIKYYEDEQIDYEIKKLLE